MLGAAMPQLAPVIGGKGGIAAAVGLESEFIILEPDDEGQDCRFVGRQTGFADINDRAP